MTIRFGFAILAGASLMSTNITALDVDLGMTIADNLIELGT